MERNENKAVNYTALRGEREEVVREEVVRSLSFLDYRLRH